MAHAEGAAFCNGLQGAPWEEAIEDTSHSLHTADGSTELRRAVTHKGRPACLFGDELLGDARVGEVRRLFRDFQHFAEVSADKLETPRRPSADEHLCKGRFMLHLNMESW